MWPHWPPQAQLSSSTSADASRQASVTDDLVQLRIADQVKIDVSKQAVSGMLKDD